MVFDRENDELLLSDPDAHKGARVEIVGKIFTSLRTIRWRRAS